MPCGYCSETARRALMMMFKILIELALVGAIASVFLVAAQGRAAERAAEELAGKIYAEELDRTVGLRRNREALSSWAYSSNITAFNQAALLETSLDVAEQEKEAWAETVTYAWHEFDDPQLRRIFQKYSQLGTAALPEDLHERLLQAVANMQANYAVATICDYKDPTKCDLALEPDITNIFAASSNADELKHAWVQWHDKAGAPMKGNFSEYVSMKNEAARLNGHSDAADWWLSVYEQADTEEQFHAMWGRFKPLYSHLHAYVRRHLRERYGEAVVPKRGPIPAHLLGNVWSQTWSNVESFSIPYPDKPAVDVTEALVEQNYTALTMFQMADGFFQSLNMTAMPELFWERSIIERPADGRDLVCHASAWDFYDKEDFRIKQCTSITGSFLSTTHHEMGHIQYYLQYRNQPVVFRAGANPGFHEAVGDVISLSVSSNKHLHRIGLLKEEVNDEESMINQLYSMALSKIAFLPYALMLDVYRYGVFRGDTFPNDYNCHFWALREQMQGVSPPVERTENDFDPPAKYHVSADVEYARYYVSYVIQFQFHRALCQLAGEYQPGVVGSWMNDCDIYGSAVAGNALSEMLKLGSSQPWPDAMEKLTNQRVMDPEGLLEFFTPLQRWLEKENERTGEYVGWDEGTVPYCTASQKKSLKKQGGLFRRKQ